METTAVPFTPTAEKDAEGFLVRPSDWSRALADATAAELGIALTETHWKVVEAARADFADVGASPGLRRLSKSSGVPIKDLYALFPDGPAKKIARVAGIPKPKSCL